MTIAVLFAMRLRMVEVMRTLSPTLKRGGPFRLILPAISRFPTTRLPLLHSQGRKGGPTNQDHQRSADLAGARQVSSVKLREFSDDSLTGKVPRAAERERIGNRIIRRLCIRKFEMQKRRMMQPPMV